MDLFLQTFAARSRRAILFLTLSQNGSKSLRHAAPFFSPYVCAFRLHPPEEGEPWTGRFHFLVFTRVNRFVRCIYPFG